MRKSLIAVGVIVILGAAWTGAAWYTGKQFQQRLPALLDEANSRIKAAFPEAGVKLAVQDYHRGLFSSRLNVVLLSDGTTGDNKPLKPGDELVLNEVVDHGPFPFAQLKKGIFVPSMASVQSRFAQTPFIKPLMAASQGKSPVSAVTRVGYKGDTVSVIDFAPLDYQDADTLIRSSGGTLNAAIGHDLAKVTLDGALSSLVVGGENQFQQREQVNLHDLSIDSDTHKGKQGYSIGDNTLKVKSLTYNLDGKDVLTTDNLSQVTTAHEDGDKLNVQVAYGLDMLHVQGQEFGSGKLTIKLSNLDAKAIAQFSDLYHNQVQQIMQQTGAADPAAQQEQITQALIHNLPVALKGSPYLSISPLSWKNSKGESAFNLTLNVNDPTQIPQGAPAATPELQLARFVNTLDAKLTIPLDMATELTTQFAKIQGYSADEAQKLAKEQVQGLAAMGQMFKLTTVDDNVLSSSFHYADNQVNLNGQKMPLQSFLGLFGLSGGTDVTPPAQPQAAPQQ
ncbi:YdgA family protein [Acerihabitans sp. KWT182]|uniref:YdgA family protein n=1 Tax=Acerihabitans sp. KWT182 TaxID=3157919 RepID=A0AAU7Q4K1_9GAMM